VIDLYIFIYKIKKKQFKINFIYIKMNFSKNSTIIIIENQTTSINFKQKSEIDID